MTAPTAEPKTISTGAGPTPAEIAQAVCKALKDQTPDGEPAEKTLWPKFWNLDIIESIEGTGHIFTGKEELQAKVDGWEAENEVTSFKVEGPYVGATGFTLVFDIGVKSKSTGETTNMREAAVYTVKDGKVIREEFMYQH